MMEDENRARPIQKKFRVSPEENALIVRKMAQANMSNFNTFARLQILTGEVKVIDFMALKELRLEINRIGQNINQVAKLVNTNEFARAEDLETLQDQLETITELVETAIANQMETV